MVGDNILDSSRANYFIRVALSGPQHQPQPLALHGPAAVSPLYPGDVHGLPRSGHQHPQA